jgi:hypothetical protein
MFDIFECWKRAAVQFERGYGDELDANDPTDLCAFLPILRDEIETELNAESSDLETALNNAADRLRRIIS